MLLNNRRRRIDRDAQTDATLVLDFARRQARKVGRVTPLDAMLTEARNSVGYALADNGPLVAYLAGTPRLTRSLRQGGLLSERATSNRALYGSDPSNAAWIKANGATAYANAAIGVDGTATAGLLVDTSAAGSTPGTWSQTVAMTANDPAIAASVYVELLNNQRRVRLSLLLTNTAGSATIPATADFDLYDNTVVSLTNDTRVYARIEPGAVGLKRLILTVQNTIGAGTAQFTLARESAAAQPLTAYVDRLQIEQGSRPTTPLAPASVLAARSGDQVSIDLTTPDAATWFNPYQGTFALDVTLRGPLESFNQALFALVQDNTNYFVAQRFVADAGILASCYAGGALQAEGLAQGAIELPRRVRLAVRYAQGNFAMAAGGLQIDVGSTPWAPEPTVDMSTGKPGGRPTAWTRLQLGSFLGGSQLDGTIHKLAYWPQPLGNADLTSLCLP